MERGTSKGTGSPCLPPAFPPKTSPGLPLDKIKETPETPDSILSLFFHRHRQDNFQQF